MQPSCKTSQLPNPPCRKEDFEPDPHPFSNRSCVPPVASGRAERGKRLNRRIAETVDSSTLFVKRDTLCYFLSAGAWRET